NPDPEDNAEAERLRRRALSASQSPFDIDAMRTQRTLDAVIDLRVPWFEWTVNRALPYERYRALRGAFIESDTQGRAIRQSILAAEDSAAALRDAQDRIREWQQS